MSHLEPTSRRALGLALAVLLSSVFASAQEPGSPSTERLAMLPMERQVHPIGKSGQEMEVVVYTPHTYDPAQSYPLLVVPDADPLIGLLKTVNFLWTEDGKAEPVILVGLPFGRTPDAIWKNRSYYLLPDAVGVIEYYDAQIPLNTGGGARELADFLHRKVLPSVLEQYNIDRDRVGLAGFSMGGLFAAWHLVTYPDVFSDYIIIAPPLAAPFVGPGFEKATRLLRRRGFRRPTRIYVSHAENDLAAVRSGAAPWIEAWKAHDDANLRFQDEVIGGLRHDAGAIPALINGYEFLYGR